MPSATTAAKSDSRPASSGDRNRRRKHLPDDVPSYDGKMRHRQSVRNFSEARLDRFHWQVEILNDKRYQKDRYQLPGHSSRYFWPKHNDEQRGKTYPNSIGVNIAEVPNVLCPLFDEVGRYLFEPKSEQVAYLRRENYQSDAGGEADDNRIGNELQKRAHPHQSHQNEQYTGN